MNSAVQCIILLACFAICSSATIIPNCQCASTIPGVRPSEIADVSDYPPRPYCRRHEVIVTLKDKTTHCLDPEQPLTKKILKRKQMMIEKMNAIRTKAAAVAAMLPAAVSATSPATKVSTSS